MKPLLFSYKSWDEYQEFTTGDNKARKKVVSLLEDIDRNGDAVGIGHPEPLKYEWSGWWSREIDKKNRLIYRTVDNTIELRKVGSHYGDK
jgi:toxin YoeB